MIIDGKKQAEIIRNEIKKEISDKIAVIEKGRVCEVGKHNDLIKRNGRYKDFCDKQLIESY